MIHHLQRIIYLKSQFRIEIWQIAKPTKGAYRRTERQREREREREREKEKE
jgi:hypothetical protein